MSVKVEHIKLKIGKQVITMSIDELKELKEVLNTIFPPNEIVFVPGHPVYIPQIIPQPLPVYPRWGEVWCQDTNTLTISNDYNQNS